MDEGLETVATFPDAIEAHLALNLLSQNGIQGLLQDENLSQMAWHLTRAIGGVKVCVARRDLEQAARIIERHESHSAGLKGEEPREERLARVYRENPRRAYRMATFSFFFPPLAVWALLIALEELSSDRRSELTPKDRRELTLAIVFSISLIAIFSLLLWVAYFS